MINETTNLDTQKYFFVFIVVNYFHPINHNHNNQWCWECWDVKKQSSVIRCSMLRCRGVECEEAALTRSPVPEQLKLSPPPRHLPAPSPDTGPNGQHLTALQISTFYNCVTNLFLCKVSAWLEYDQTNHHVSAAQESTRPLLLSSSARPEHRCGYLYISVPASWRCVAPAAVWLWVVAGGKQLALCSPLWHRTCPLDTCTPLALVAL